MNEFLERLFPTVNREQANVAFARTFVQTLRSGGPVSGGVATVATGIDWPSFTFGVAVAVGVAFLAGADAWLDVAQNGISPAYAVVNVKSRKG